MITLDGSPKDRQFKRIHEKEWSLIRTTLATSSEFKKE